MKRIKEYSKQLFSKKAVAYLFMATLVFSLGYLAGSGNTTYFNTHVKLYNGFRFDATQQRAADNALASAGLRDYQWVGDRLRVPKDKLRYYIAVLAESDVLVPVVRQHTADSFRPFISTRVMDSRMISATERSTADAIKLLPGIANAVVMSNNRPEWERNVWARRQTLSVSVVFDSTENRPLPDETVVAIGRIVAPAFGITDMKEISIVDARNNLRYDGSGEPIVEVAQLHE